jgi:hypothetical protein
MNPLRKTFHLLCANRLKKEDQQPVFSALGFSTILAFLNLLVLTMVTDPFTGYFTWLGNHGVPTLVVIALSVFAIGTAQYLCWIHNGKLERECARIEHGASPRPILVYGYIALSFVALPIVGILMHKPEM